MSLSELDRKLLCVVSLYSVDVSKAFQLVEQGANPDTYSARRKTLLYSACEEGNLEVVTSLIERGANLNIQDNSINFSPLMCACENNHLDIVKALLKAGANQALVCADGNTAFAIACIEMNLEIAKVLCKGSDINAQNEVLNTPLITAACIGGAAIDIMKFLLDNGADLETKNKYDNNALDCAIHYRHESIVDFLEEETVRRAELKSSLLRRDSISSVFGQGR